MDERFEDAFSEVIGLEGGYSNDPNDAGGETNWGISKRAYPHLDIKNLTKAHAKLIYYTDYWLKISLDKVKDKLIAIEIFEAGVNLGISKAVFNAQRGLNFLGSNLKQDGVMGPVTLKVINNYLHRDALLKCLNGLQFMHYLLLVENNPSQKIYARGWLRRVDF